MRGNTLARVIMVSIFGFIGVVFFIVGIVFLGDLRSKQASYDKITAVVVDSYNYGSDNSGAYINYTYNGEEYKRLPLTYSSDFIKDGDEMTIYVNPDDPYDYIVLSGTVIMVSVFGGLGLLFIIIALTMILIPAIRAIKKRTIINSSNFIWAEITDIRWNTHVSVNGYNPFVIYAIYHDPYTGVPRELKSKNIYDDPYDIIKPGDQIKVFLKDDKFKRYVFDTSKLDTARKAREE